MHSIDEKAGQKGIIMAFRMIDIENWERKEFYEHFINQVVCTYSVVVNLDIQT